MQEHEKIFVDYLKSRDLKLTRSRRIILNTVFELHEHFDVEQLYDHIKGIASDVSRATIYRTLPLLIESGLIQQSVRNASRDVFEHIYGHPKHLHWICNRCGNVIETDMSELMPLIKRGARQLKFQSEDFKFNIRGTCWKCQTAENENQ